MQNQPGYWSQVFAEAVKIIHNRPGIDGETAFWLARAEADKKADQPQLALGEVRP